jgi:hypothetical protein
MKVRIALGVTPRRNPTVVRFLVASGWEIL